MSTVDRHRVTEAAATLAEQLGLTVDAHLVRVTRDVLARDDQLTAAPGEQNIEDLARWVAEHAAHEPAALERFGDGRDDRYQLLLTDPRTLDYAVAAARRRPGQRPADVDQLSHARDALERHHRTKGGPR